MNTSPSAHRAFVNGFWGMVEKVPDARGERLVERLTKFLETLMADEREAMNQALLGRGRAPTGTKTTAQTLWWFFPIVEPPYAGDPREDDFPDYYTHWTPIVCPKEAAGG